MSGSRTFPGRTVTPDADLDLGDLARFLVWLEEAARAEGTVEQLAARLGDQTLQLAEQLAAVYEWSGRPEEARRIRLRAAGLRLRPSSDLTS